MDNGINTVVDFDAFWAEYSETAPKEKVRFLGELIVVPFDLPLELEQKMTTANVRNRDELANLLQEIYGENVLDRWVSKGLGVKQMAVLVAWTLQKVQGGNMTLREIAEGMQNMVSSGKLKVLLDDTGGQ